MKYSNILLKTLIAFVLLFISATNSQAQEKIFSHEINFNAGYGVLKHYNPMSGYSDNISYYNQTGGKVFNFGIQNNFWLKNKNGIAIDIDVNRYQIWQNYIFAGTLSYQLYPRNKLTSFSPSIKLQHKFNLDSATSIVIFSGYSIQTPISKKYVQNNNATVVYTPSASDTTIVFDYNL